MTTRSPRGRIGSTIRDKYRVDTFLATGSMANVYAATHRNGGKVALKILHRELASDPQMRERFKREGYFCNAIDHPGIAKAIDDDITDDDCPYIVMDLLEGENLEVRRKRLGGRLPLNEVLNVADKVLDILSVAHDKGILHRDLKPENIFFTHDGVVKLLDFGVARFNDGKQSSEVTGVGMVLGTPAFMPPEQALGLREEVDARSDLWALGATLFTLLTGESVHTGDTAKAKLVATATKPARKLREVLPNLPSAATSVIDRALEYHRSERWDDAIAMREALRWARMSLDPEAEVMTSSSPMIATANSIDTTRRVKAFTDDEPTVMRKSVSEEDVFTSAPPVTARAAMPTMPDDRGPALSESGESSIAFSLRNDPVFSLRQQKEKKKESERPPNTQRLPNTPDNDLGLPSLEPPMSEDVRMEYTRPMMAIPAGLRGTMPLPNTPGTGSGSMAAVKPNPIPQPPPSSPQVTSPPPSNPSNRQPNVASLPAPVPSAAPPSSGTGTKVFLALLLVAMLGGTVVILMMKKGAMESRTTSTTLPSASVSAAPAESTSAAASAEPSPTTSASSEATAAPSGSAAPEPIASASASASAAPVVVAKPRPRPRPTATATATASAAATSTGSPEATATTTSTATAITTSTSTSTAAPTAAPVPVPIPVPSPQDPSP